MSKVKVLDMGFGFDITKTKIKMLEYIVVFDLKARKLKTMIHELPFISMN